MPISFIAKADVTRSGLIKGHLLPCIADGLITEEALRPESRWATDAVTGSYIDMAICFNGPVICISTMEEARDGLRGCFPAHMRVGRAILAQSRISLSKAVSCLRGRLLLTHCLRASTVLRCTIFVFVITSP